MAINLNIGTWYYPETIEKEGYKEVARFQLKNHQILGTGIEAIRYEKENEICVAVEHEKLLKIISYYNLETGKCRRLIRGTWR